MGGLFIVSNKSISENNTTENVYRGDYCINISLNFT